MRICIAILVSVLMIESVRAQPVVWLYVGGTSPAYSNQRAQVQAMVNEFVARLQTVLPAPNHAETDSYPSERAAVESMVDDFVRELRSSPGFTEGRWRIVVSKLSEKQSGIPPLPDGNVGVSGSWGSGGYSAQIDESFTKTAAQQAINQAVARLRRQLPHTKITTGDFPDASVPNVAVLGLGVGEIEQIEQSTPIVTRGNHGRIAARIMVGETNRQVEARFGDQRWVDDWQGFLNLQPQKSWIVGRSSSLFANQADALKSACDDAAEQFAQQTRGRAQMYGNLVPYDTLKVLAFSHFQVQGVADQFVQRVESPTGSGWHASVLVQADEAAIRAIIPGGNANVQTFSSRGEVKAWSGFGSIIVMVLVIIVMYLFLRGATRGFFTANMKVSALVMLFLVAMLLLVGGLFVTRVSYSPSAMPASVDAVGHP